MNTQEEQLLIARNAELEKDLAAKNRELKIEAALERVRTIALSMKEPADAGSVLHYFKAIRISGCKRNQERADSYPL